MTKGEQMERQTELLMDIQVKVGKIETHLSDMNGKLIRHEEFILKECPLQREKFYTKINELKTSATKGSVNNSWMQRFGMILVTAVVTALTVVGVNKLFG